MGAWGTGSFENDDAADFAYELCDADGYEAIDEAFDMVLEADDEELEAPEGSVAIAAADVLAALLGKPPRKLPKDVAAWVRRQKKSPSAALVKKAERTVKRLLGGDSELVQTWNESDNAAGWRRSVKGLLARLTRK